MLNIDHLIGQVFGSIHVISVEYNDYDWYTDRAKLIVECTNHLDAGTYELDSGCLLYGTTRQCQICCSELTANRYMLKHRELVGRTFGTLEVIDVGETDHNRKKLMIVKCNKHPEIEPFPVVKQSLLNGLSTGCKICWIEKHTKHGKHDSVVYHIYKGILGRCLNPNHKNYDNYGGRGITIDPKYDPNYNDQGLVKAFLAFYEDIGDIPVGMSLDRVDNDDGYRKGNLRVIPKEDQAKHRRDLNTIYVPPVGTRYI
jgi:hypothetical protein